VVTVGTVAKVLTVPLAAMRIVPERSAKKSRPSGAHASAVAKFAPSTNTDSPGAPLTVTGGDAHGSGGVVVVVIGGAVVVDAGFGAGERAARSSEPPQLATMVAATITTTGSAMRPVRVTSARR
jgi:hypothetical protein